MAEQSPPVDKKAIEDKKAAGKPNPDDAAIQSGNPNDPRWQSADKVQQDNAEKMGEELDPGKDDKSGGR